MAGSRRRCAAPGCSQLLPAAARASTLFCSPACRQRAHRRRLMHEILDDMLADYGPRRCDFCNRAIADRRGRGGAERAVRSNIIYCNARCRQRSYRLRQRGRQLRNELGINVDGRRSS